MDEHISYLNNEYNKVEVLPLIKSSTQGFGYPKPEIVTLVSYGEITNLSATLKKANISDFEIAEINAKPTGKGGYLTEISVKPKKSLPEATYTDILILSGKNQGNQYSFEVPITIRIIEGYTSVENFDLLSTSLYPNPNNGHFNLNFAEHGTYRISIVNIAGQVLKQEIVAGQDVQTDISDYPNGVYLIIVENGNYRKTIKVVKE